MEEISERLRAFPYPVLRFPSWRKNVDSTAISRVLRQATIQKISVIIVNVWVVLVAKRALPDGQFLQQRLRLRKLIRNFLLFVIS